MQKYSYHTHTNSFGIFDGHNSAVEMIRQAEKIGYKEIGISNHFVFHPNMTLNSPMFFNDEQKAVDTLKKTIYEIRSAAEVSDIKVYAGFEVDFFPSAVWRNAFERIIKQLDADYFIGSSHFCFNKDESQIINMYLYKEYEDKFTIEEEQNKISRYWQNVAAAAESGYFAFLGHLDVYKIFPHFAPLGNDDDKWAVIETLGRLKHPYELNTSGWAKCGEQHPADWMLKELNKRDVPVLINDDAHDVSHLGRYYQQAEDLLASMNYKNRWKMTL